MCHGDISLANIVINRRWSDAKGKTAADDRDKSKDTGIDKNDSEDDIPIVNYSNVPRKSSTPNAAVISDPTRDAPPPSSAHGLVIDFDNSFSLVEAAEDGYRTNSVRFFLLFCSVSHD